MKQDKIVKCEDGKFSICFNRLYEYIYDMNILFINILSCSTNLLFEYIRRIYFDIVIERSVFKNWDPGK